MTTPYIVRQPRVFIAYGAHAITGEADTELVTWTGHGLVVGDAVAITTLVGGTGLTALVPYYVKTAPDANTLTLSSSVGGATAEFSADITAGSFAAPILLLDDYCAAATIDQPSEVVDVRTFGDPRISEAGGGIDTVTLALLWSQELYALMLPWEGEQGTLYLFPEAATQVPRYVATVGYDVAPLGRLAIGEKVESDLLLGVEDGITRVAA